MVRRPARAALPAGVQVVGGDLTIRHARRRRGYGACLRDSTNVTSEYTPGG